MSEDRSITTPAYQNSTTSLWRGWLFAARAAWLAIAGTALAMYTIGLPTRITELVTVSPVSKLNPKTAALLIHAGISPSAFFWYILLSELLLAGVFFVAAVLLIWRRPSDLAVILISILLISYGCTESSFTNDLVHANHLWLWPRKLLQISGEALSLIVFYIIPDGRFVPRWTRWVAWAYAVLCVLWLGFPTLPFNVVYAVSFNATPLSSTLFVIAWHSTGVYALIYRYRHSASPQQRQQIKWVVFGLVIAFGTTAVRYIVTGIVADLALLYTPQSYLIYNLLVRPVHWYTLLVVPICFAIAMLRHRLWDIDPLINRVLVYGALTVALAAVYIGSVFGVQQALQIGTGQSSSLAVFTATLLSAALFRPLQRNMQLLVDRRFDREKVDVRAALDAFTHELRTIIDLPDLLHALVGRVAELLKIQQGALFLRAAGGTFAPVEAYQLPDSTAALTLSAEEEIQLQRDAVCQRANDRIFQLLVPINATIDRRRELIGVLALGPRRSGQPYSAEVRDLLRALAGESGTAITVARLIESEQQLRAYQASPAGRAEALARQLQAQPSMCLHAIHQLATRAATEDGAANLLNALPQAFRALQAVAPADLADGYCYIRTAPTAPELVKAGVRRLVVALEATDATTWDQSFPATQIYRACLTALDLADIAALAAWQAPNPRQALAPAQIADVGVTTERAFLAELERGLADLGPIVTLVRNTLRVSASDERLHYLSEARDATRRLARAAAALPATPDHMIMGQIANHWDQRITMGLRRIQAQAELELHLITRHVAPAAEVTLALAIENRGRGPATKLRLELLPDANDHIITQPDAISILLPGQRETLFFQARTDGQPTLSLNLRLRYSDPTDDDLVHSATLVVTMLSIPIYTQPLPNPYQPGTPLRPASPLFFGRTDDIAFVRDSLSPADSGRALVLTGQRRMGKTSLLRQLNTQLGPQYRTIYIDGQTLGLDPGIEAFFADLALAIAQALGLPEPAPDQFALRPAAQFTHTFLPIALAAAGEQRLILLIDEYEELEVRVARGKFPPEVLSYLRHLMQHESRMGFIFVGTHRLDELNPQYWSAFFNAALHYRITCLDTAAAYALIATPLIDRLCYDDLAINHMLRATGGHPYFLQLLCHVLVHNANQERRCVVAPDHVRLALPQALALGEAHLVNIWSESHALERAILICAAFGWESKQFTADQLHARLVAPLPAKPNQIDAALRRLVQRDLLKVTAAHETAAHINYSWRLELLSDWIMQHHPAA